MCDSIKDPVMKKKLTNLKWRERAILWIFLLLSTQVVFEEIGLMAKIFFNHLRIFSLQR